MGSQVKSLLKHGDFSFDKRELYGNHCVKCDEHFFPRRSFCPSCLQMDSMEDFIIPNQGNLYTFTVIHIGSKKFNPPYAIGYVDVEPNLRLIGHIQGIETEQLKINQKMNITIGQVGSEEEERLFGIVFNPKEENQQ